VVDTTLITGIRVEKTGFVEVPDPVRTKNPDTDPGLWLRSQGDTPLELVMRRGARLSGRVAAGDEPVRGALVLVQRRRAHANQVFTDSDGRYVIDGIASGPVLVQVLADEFVQKDWDWDRSTEFWSGKASAVDLEIPEVGDVVHDVEMERGIAVSGHVIDAQGAPVAGAIVTGGNVSQVVTDSQGAFRVIGGVTNGRVYVGARHRESGWGMLDAAVPLDRTIVDASIPLTAPPRVRGRVTAIGELLGAWVQATRAPQGDQEPWWGDAPPLPVSPDGTFDIAVESVGGVLVRAGAEGLSSVTVSASRRADGSFEAEIHLAPAQPVTGRVVSATTRAAIPGAEVQLLEPKGGRFEAIRTGAPQPGVIAATSGSDGTFRIDEVASGPRLLRVQAAGFVAVETSVDVPFAGELVVALDTGATISGRVAFADGTPIVRASVSAKRWVEDAQYAGGRRPAYFGFANTDETGRYSIASLPAGDFDLLVAQSLSQEKFANAERTDVAGGTENVDFVVERPAEGLGLRGRVVGADGTPLGGVIVGAQPASGRTFGSATSRDDGSFVIEGLEATAYTDRASPPPGSRFIDLGVTFGARYLAGSVESVVPPRDDVLVTLPLGETIAGVVVDALGAPMTNVWVAAGLPVSDEDARSRGFGGPPAAETDGAGRFEITGLRPGATFRLVAVGLPGATGSAPLIGGERVESGTHGLRLAIGAFAKVSGRVVDASGSPVSGARVSTFGATERSARTDADGRFTLDALAKGAAFDVVAWTEALAPKTLASVPAGSEGLLLTLHEGVHATGRVLARDGRALSQTKLILRTPGCPVSVETATDRDGRFDVGGLLGARYRVAYVGLVDGEYRELPCGELDGGAVDAELRAE
jgi:protocatechuate 3,4-dioxygenase beta subunit